ncbi:phosphate acyltransferase [Tissierella praeacuta]|uniref:phosphate acyltransferase n=1 Tax=Tissierella praeacuta TaxID=43131 RepID=UPI00289976A7|nr:phosphate acyltransferase [Tissierella praeacuta]
MRNFEEARLKALNFTIKPTVVVPCPYDKNILEALIMVQENGIANIILIGNKNRVDSIIDQYDLDFRYETFIEIDEDLLAIEEAHKLLITHGADIIMKGLVQTKDFMRILLSNKDFMESKLLTHVAIYEVPSLNRLLFVSDPSIVVEPTIYQKKVIIDNALELIDCLDMESPKVAIVSSTEVLNEKVKSSVDAVEITKMYVENNKATIYGPLAIDNAISREASKLKKIESLVAGNADLLIMPNLDAGNIFCKGLTYIGNIESAGVVMGAKKPIVLTSRSANPKEKFNSIIISCLMVDKKYKKL